MRALRSLLNLPAGRRTKWLVLVFWLVLVAVLGPLSGKLTGAEKNDASSWLPPKAESTQVLNLRSRSSRRTCTRRWSSTTGRPG